MLSLRSPWGAKLPESAEEIDGFIKYCEENAEAINKAYEEFRYTVTIPETVKILGQHDYVMKVLVQRAELAQAGYVPADYKEGLNFAQPGELNGEIPVDIQRILDEADDITSDDMAEI